MMPGFIMKMKKKSGSKKVVMEESKVMTKRVNREIKKAQCQSNITLA